MNKYQKALDYLISNGTHETLYSWGDEFEVETEHGEESRKLLQELVARETPMKPNGIKCPKCGSWGMENTHTGTLHYHRCRNVECEQLLDWSKDDGN